MVDEKKRDGAHFKKRFKFRVEAEGDLDPEQLKKLRTNGFISLKSLLFVFLSFLLIFWLILYANTKSAQEDFIKDLGDCYGMKRVNGAEQILMMKSCQCITSSDCGTGKRCFHSVNGTSESRCIPQDDKCYADYHCINGMCRTGRMGNKVCITHECIEDSDCPYVSFDTCSYAQCDQNRVCNVHQKDSCECIYNSNCPGLQRCLIFDGESFCLQPPENCRYDRHCKSNEICQNGNCVPKNPCYFRRRVEYVNNKDKIKKKEEFLEVGDGEKCLFSKKFSDFVCLIKNEDGEYSLAEEGQCLRE